ncbi:MAG: ABC transporter substrate-binding protein [Ruminococcaceae bacterium]|nr:ABC transporter substrate-binding protein [Oscillospiraceae bacterium]
MKKRILAIFLVLGMVSALLAGCGGKKPSDNTDNTGSISNTDNADSNETSQRTERAEANEIVIGVPQDFDSLDPDYMTAAGTKEVMFNVYEGLVKPTSDGEIVPAVASDVRVEDDGLTYVFTLRQGVKFHNGDTVDMQDVLFSLDRRRSGEDAAAYLKALDIIADVQGEGDTLTITLSEPSGEFLAFMMNVYIIPADVEALDVTAVGTGPFKVVSRAAQDNLVLERFDDYWGTPAKVAKVTCKIIETADALVRGLQSGALDMVSHMTYAQTSQLDKNSFHVEEGSMNLVQALYLNNSVKPFDDVRVRQALCYGVDKQGIIDLAFDGYGTPLGTSMFPSFAKYYDDSLTDYYTYDVAKAKELLAQAGYPDGFEMTITVPRNYEPHMDAAEVIVEQLKAIGVKATILPVDWDSWLDNVYGKSEFQSTITGLTSDNMTARKLLERFNTAAGNNFTRYDDAAYDELFAKAVACTDDAEQTELYRQMERNLTENAANVYIQDMADLVAMRSGLEGLAFYPLYAVDLSTLYWAE